MIAGHDNMTVSVGTRKIDLVEWIYITFASIIGALRDFLFEDAPSFKTRALPPMKGKRDCVLVIDVSGSMFLDD